MDPTAIAGMLFVLMIIAMVGGFILLLPISRRLGAFLEQRLNAGRAAGSIPAGQLSELREVVLSLQSQVQNLSDRQDFVDRLLTEGSEAGEQGRSLRGGRPIER